MNASVNIFKDKSGVALILVIWVMVILIAIVGEFSYSMRTEINITRNFKEEEESYQLALSGIERAKIEILSAKEPLYTYLSEEGILIFSEGDENPERKGELGNGTFSYTIIDEDGKLNINNTSLPQLRYIIKSVGVDITMVDIIADSIIDWRDTNELHMLNGAEEDYYRSLERPYSCKDGPFDIIDELLLVRGVTPEIFKGLAPYLTSWSSGRININTASREVLEAVFGITATENILRQREAGPILTPVSGGTVSSFFFTIISTGATKDGQIKRAIKTTLKKKGKKFEVIYWNDNFTG
jgi:general secretion pathway protein K